MRLLYDIFFILFAIFYIPNLLWKGKFHRGFLERFGFLPKKTASLTRPLWIHAVSVGEAVLAAKLAKSLKENFGRIAIIVSTTTKTGNNMIRTSGMEFIDMLFYYPLDISWVISRVVRRINPRAYVMIETELWPNLLEEFRLKKIPVILANGRISDASYLNYKRIAFITRRIISCISTFCMQSQQDAERMLALGASRDNILITGNIKFDEEKVAPLDSRFNREKLGFNEDDKIIVAGSTHFPEEKILIDIYRDLREKERKVKLILAPRHVERRDAVKVYVEKAGLKYRLFSDMIMNNELRTMNYELILVDTIGHLKDLYSVADIVFIGGSLVKKGGQNPIEPARWGKVILFGPHMFNFKEVANIFLENKAALCVKDALGLKKELERLLRDQNKVNEMSKNAVKVIQENSGALVRTVERIEQYVV